jgi:ABC-type glycerol-3-phosphate transport system substrate-binding protein
MKRIAILAGSALLVLAAAAAQAADKVTIQLKWVTQAQFAGYYVAQDKGFYEAEGLDVTIKPGGPDVSPAAPTSSSTGCPRPWRRGKRAWPWSTWLRCSRSPA